MVDRVGGWCVRRKWVKEVKGTNSQLLSPRDLRHSIVTAVSSFVLCPLKMLRVGPVRYQHIHRHTNASVTSVS